MSLMVWEITIAALLAVLAFDLALAVIRRNKETSMKEAAAWTIFYVSAAIAFGYSLGVWNTTQSRGEFFAGWITEYSLSVDNLFIFILILARFKIDKTRQQLVLLIGIIMALILRGIFIALGSAAISRFSWVFYIFGAFLLFTAYKLISESGEKEWKEGKLITWFRKKGASPLYFLLGGLMNKLIYLTQGLAIILGFIGVKLIIEAIHGGGTHKILGVEIPEISTQFSLIVIVGTLVTTTIASLIVSSKSKVAE